MATSHLSQLDLSPEPDLHPLYPTTSYIASLLSSHSGLAPAQKAELVSHCLTRACVFGDLTILQFLLSDPQAQIHVDLGMRDEDGLGLVSLTIHGFGSESERDVEREECVRLLVAQGADMRPDKAGWTSLHHAALLSPPTLISYLMTHGCSPFDATHRNLTPLDIVTAHSTIPGRDDVALLLEEAMRGEGWTGSRMEQKRRLEEARSRRRGRRKEIRKCINRVLNINPRWWGNDTEYTSSDSSDSDSDSEGEDEGVDLFTPIPDYTSMLVFSPPALPTIFDSLINNYQPTFHDTTPASTLYMLTRFACLTCDQEWLEELVDGATREIEELLFRQPEDIAVLIFWLHNVTIWLHFVQCDRAISDPCEVIGTFDLLEDLVNSAYVHIIRFIERRIDQLFDAAMLDYSPSPSDIDSVQFESEWSFLRPFSGKKKVTPSNTPARGVPPTSPTSGSRPRSPTTVNQANTPTPTSKSFSSLRQSFNRARSGSSATPLSSLFPDGSAPPAPKDLTSFLAAVHTLLVLSDVNPAIIVQIWSQVMYWTACELFNRILGRKKYLCRSRAIQISSNMANLEDWIDDMGLPQGVHSHFAPVDDLLIWLQKLSSINDFSNLITTIQGLKNINPLQMRRAVREYKYEVNEGRMTDECIQYLTQIHKDWERHRVKLGVEAIKKEIHERDKERDFSVSSSTVNDAISDRAHTPSVSTVSSETSSSAQNIDTLFDKQQGKQVWEPIKSPPSLGEFFNSRYMLPLLFPSDPRMLAARPGKVDSIEDDRLSFHSNSQYSSDSRSSSRVSDHQPFPWRLNCRKLRDVGLKSLQRLDGARRTAQWGKTTGYEEDATSADRQALSWSSDEEGESGLKIDTHTTPFTRKPSSKGRGRFNSCGETTPVERR
ncbi:hypothetical protein AMATHDRAFT_60449 [Amanita thiersii Skay4041]|uniref:Dilute domain-containing protein n=1 Tax=Amanita thiersii Skay4041 TaxID=703135 RepID=A0A2A9NRB5_9AGAR|nr:hypothetical protein AMATHDRAFT_60449 [Amanita thiersii Skay4041]